MHNSIEFTLSHPHKQTGTLTYCSIDTKVGSGFIAVDDHQCVVYFGFNHSAVDPEDKCRAYFNNCIFKKLPVTTLNLRTCPLKLYGSAFQHKVWQALLTIPMGHPISYRQLASQIGQPQSVRAVASAVACNPLSGFIPCHRVIYSSGQFGHYAWGAQLKRQLLYLEENNQHWLGDDH